MHRNEDEIARLRNQAARLHRQRQEDHDHYFSELTRNPNTGWTNNFHRNDVYEHLQENGNTYKKDHYKQFINMHMQQHLYPEYDRNGHKKPPAAFVANVLQGREFTFKGVNYRPPFYFEILPNNDHAVLVEVRPGGDVYHLNELHSGSYDQVCERILGNMGFAKNKIHMRETSNDKYIQRDGWSCGDRAIRNFEEAIGSESPYTHSPELRQHTHALLETTWRQRRVVIELDERLAAINARLASLGAEPSAAPEPVASIVHNPEDDKKMPSQRPNLCAPQTAARVREALQKAGWECTDNISKDGTLTSITITHPNKKDDPNYKFEVQKDQIYTQSTDKETFKAMLLAFKLAHPGVTPSINTCPKENAQKWEQAYCEVYHQKSAPPGVVNALESAPKAAPAPMEDKPEVNPPRLK